MKRLAALGMLTCAACGDWPELDPDDRPWPLDERLGVEVHRTDRGLRIASAYQQDGLQIFFEVTGDGWYARLIDPETLAIIDLPGPALPPGERINVGRALPPALAVLSTVDDAGAVLVQVLDGDEWTTLPALPVTGSDDDQGQLLAHDGRVYATFASRVFVSDGGAWSEPVRSPGSVLLSGFDDSVQWMLAGDGLAFSAIPVSASGQLGAEVPGPTGVGLPAASAINGDAGGFQVAADGTIYMFDGVAFTPGADIGGSTLWTAPGHDRVVASLGSDATGTWTIAENGALGAPVLLPFTPRITCACDITTDPSCACLAHEVGYVDLRPAPTSDRIGMTMADDVNGYAVLSVRFLDLPFAGDPFAP